MIDQHLLKALSMFTMLCLLSVGFSVAKPPVNFSDKAMSFLKKRNNLSSHRLNGKPIQKLKDEKSKAYFVNIGATDKTIKFVQSSLKKSFFITENGFCSIKIRNQQFKINKKSLENPKRLGEILPKLIFSKAVADQFDLLSIDTELTYDSESSSEFKSGFVFNYQRVFNNRIVRNENNYLIISIDSKGYFKWAVVSMEDLSIGNKFVQVNESLYENKESLDSVVAVSFSSVYTENFSDSLNVNKIKVNSAAEAYCQIDSDFEKILVPCISYVSEMHLDNEEVLTTIIDAPHSMKSWRNFQNAQKKPTRLASLFYNPLRLFPGK